jgi:hypothetical protein
LTRTAAARASGCAKVTAQKNLNKKQLPEITLERKEISFTAESKSGFGVRLEKKPQLVVRI